jgi:hypothetical protein
LGFDLEINGARWPLLGLWGGCIWIEVFI